MRENLFWASVLITSLLSVALHLAGIEGLDSLLLLVLVSLISVYTIWEVLHDRRFETEHLVNLLMVSVGSLTYWLDLHLEGTLLLGMFGLAEILEHAAMERAESGLKELMEYLPRKARVERDGELLEVEFDSIRRGDLVVVARGERVPVDGLVVRGRGHLDQSVVTGEPLPVAVEVGSYVHSGSLLVDGSIVVRALKVGGETFISRMLAMVEEFKGRKSSGERLVQRFSRYYLPLMLALSGLAWLVLGARAAIVLVAVACPSAFLVAAPATTLTSLAVAARRGVLFKGSAPVERASKVRVVALDKTGTVTLGRLVVREIHMGEEDFRLLASLELASQHPVARAIVEEARSRGLRLTIPEEVEEIPGEGIRGVVEGVEVIAGKASFVGVPGAESEGIAVHALIGGRYGYVTLGDVVNPLARRVVERLREMGLRVAMLTGDREENARPIAEGLGISELHANLSPEEKVEIVRRLRASGPVAMVGDGINDAPALAAADVGIAVGSLEASIEAGDVALVSGISSLPWLFEASRSVVSTFWSNMALVGASKAFAALLGVIGYIPLWAAVALGDDGGLLLVMVSLVRLVRRISGGGGLRGGQITPISTS